MLPGSKPSVNGTPSPFRVKDDMDYQDCKIMPIAIIGLAGRFPGEATNARNLWDMCCSGRSAWSEMPAARFTASAYFHPNPSKIGCFNSKGAHFLKEDVGLFDAPFFGISPNEAKAMDPQQRLLLETTYEALENAGIGLAQVNGTQTGVYVGASSIDYADILKKDVDDIPIYQATGTSANILSNRISYVYNLKGTSITMDTACSSSLVALHTACNSLRSSENKQAIVCGSHLMLSPDTMVGMSMLRLFGEDGKSYTYDSRGTGYGRGEGVATVLLKPLQDAIRDGDHIRAVIRNTGANQDGKTNGITFPSKDAQAQLMRSVYDTAGLDPFGTDYVEAHGTGTAAGDPVEAEAISSVFGANRTVDDPVIVGSVKTNIGHLEAASGLAAVVKSILALEHQVIPPNINFEKPNKDIPLEAWRLKICTSPTPWQRPYPRRASISNFGFGGTNVHVILEQYENKTEHLNGQPKPSYQAAAINHDSDSREANGTQTNGILTSHANESRRRLFVFSANDKSSLRAQMHGIATYLDERKETTNESLLDRLSYTLGQRRSLLEWRSAVSATTATELSEALLSTDVEPTKAPDKTNVAFVFTGQGSQWYAMGRSLLQFPIFRDALHEADQVLRNIGAEWSLLDELAKDAKSTLIDRAYISQPATTAIQIALVSLLASWNVRPSAVVGHSSGEIGAAYAAGALTLDQCMQVSYHRGVLAATLKEKRPERPGSMLAIGATPSKVRPMIKRFGSSHVVLACNNGPTLVTVSGDSQAIAEIQTIAEDEKLLNRRLKVDVAYHSPHMRDIAEDYLAAIKSIEPMRNTSVQFFSSVAGRQIDTADLTALYWVQNMTRPVQFVGGVESMYSQAKGPEVLVEIGPHSTLKSPIQDILKRNPSWAAHTRYLPSLVRDCDASLTALSLASELYALGCELNLPAINNGPRLPPLEPLHDLPSYPWNHARRYWHESRLSLNHRLKRFPRNDLLGSLVDDLCESEPRWRNVIRLADIPWLRDHSVQGTVVFPATGYLSMALEATSQYNQMRNIMSASISQYKFRKIKIARPMMLSEDDATEISFTMRPEEESRDHWMEFAVSSWTQESGWTEHCRGLASIDRNGNGVNPVNGERYLTGQQDQHQSEVADFHSKCNKAVSREDVYAQFSRAGLYFGPTFQNFKDGRATKDHAVGTITVPDTSITMPYGFESPLLIHPTTFDACLQVIEVASAGGDMSGSDLHVPTFFKQITIDNGLFCKPNADFSVFATRQRPFCDLDADLHAELFVTSANNEKKPLIQIQGFVGSLVPGQGSTTPAARNRGLCYRLHWQPCLDMLSREEYTRIFTQRSSTQLVLNQIEDLEKAAFHYIKSAFKGLAESDMDIPKSHLGEYHRVLSQLLEQGQHGTLAFQTPDWLDDTDDAKALFLDGFVSNETARMVRKIGENLGSIVTGKTDPLSIMVQDNGLSNFYRDHEGMKVGNASCASMVATLAHQKPNMRILEIGAGTGATTTSILLALGQNFSHYEFTDISMGFFDRARKEQASWSEKMSYRKLDIEQDPIAQGFELEYYDLIIAVNVLHATAHMDTTMRNTRRLLRPGGKAVISEITGQLLSSLLVFGTLPGWWLGEESERRDGPFLAESAWDATFRRTGFSGLDGSAQVFGEEYALASVMITSAAGDQSPGYPTPTLITCSESHTVVDERLASALNELTGSQPPPTKRLFEATLIDNYGIVLAMEDPVLAELDEPGLDHLRNMFCEARGLLWVTRGARSEHPEANMITGFARSFRGENAGLRLVTLDLDGENKLPDDQISGIITRVFRHTFGADINPFVADMEYVESHGILHVGRLKLDSIKDDYVVHETYSRIPEKQPFKQPGRPLELAIGQVGLLDSIQFQDRDALAGSLQSNQVEIMVQATGLNFQDIMIALGQIPFYHPIGSECSGIVTAVGSDVTDIEPGTRVFAFAHGAYANTVRTRRHEIAVIPDKLDFPQAASMPVVFGTAHFALSELARLSKGDSILIHAAAGGVGQAAIMLAQHIKAVVYVTVGSVEKKSFIMQTYNIPETHIFSSRDTSFQGELMLLTEQRGVDVILNSTAGEMLQESWQCLAPLGRFIEIGKRDLVQNSSLPMEKFLDSVTFCSIDLGVLAKIRPELCNRVLTDVVNMYNDGVIRPISPITVFPMSDIQQAMRQMQAGKHTGKLVIDTAAECMVQVLPAKSPKAIQDPAASYVITGGTGGLGRSITRWLSREGAKHIILLSRSGTNQRGVAQLVKEQQQQGINVVVRKCDVANAKEVHETLSECHATMPPIKGVIHGAMALHDALFEKITFADWQLNTKPRVQGARNLHRSLHSLNSPLDFFIMLASISGITGPRGQTAYSASNTFLDSFASQLRHHHSPPIRATAIDIGIVSDVGYVAENVQREAEISVVAPDRLSEPELLALVKGAITGAYEGDGLPQQTYTGLKLLPDKPLPFFSSDPKFAHLVAAIQGDASGKEAAGDEERLAGKALHSLLKSVNGLDEAAEVVSRALVGKLCSLLMIGKEDVSVGKPVVAYGLDSLVAVELRNWITVDLEATVSLMELMNSPSIGALAGKIAVKSKLVDTAMASTDGNVEKAGDSA